MSFGSIAWSRDYNAANLNSFFQSIYDITVPYLFPSGNTMEVSGNLFVKGNLHADSMTISGSKYIGNDLDVSGDLIVESNALVKQDLFVNGVLHASSMSVSGNKYIGGDLDVSGDLTIESNALVKQDLFVNGALHASSLTISGNKQVGSNLDISGDLTVESNALIKGDLDVSTDATIDGTATIGTLNITSNTTATGSISVNDIRPRTGKVVALAVNAPGNQEGLIIPGFNQPGVIFASLSGGADVIDSVNFGYNVGYDPVSNIVYNQSVNTTSRNGYILSAAYDKIGVYRLPLTNAKPTGGPYETLFTIGNTGTGTGTSGNIQSYLASIFNQSATFNDVATFNSNIVVDDSNVIQFDLTTAPKINLYSTTYGMGIQPSTLYNRVSTGAGFSWYLGGTQSNACNDPGTGGVLAARLDSTGLYLNGDLNCDDLRVRGEQLVDDDNNPVFYGIQLGGGTNPQTGTYGGIEKMALFQCNDVSQNPLAIQFSTVGQSYTNLQIYDVNTGYTDLSARNAGGISFGGKNSFGGYVVQYAKLTGIREGNFQGGLVISTMRPPNLGQLFPSLYINQYQMIKLGMIDPGNGVQQGGVQSPIAIKGSTGGNLYGEHIYLYSNTYTMGTQSNTLFNRAATGGGFSWYVGGTQSNASNNPGGGTVVARVDTTGVKLPTLKASNAGLGVGVVGYDSNTGELFYSTS